LWRIKLGNQLDLKKLIEYSKFMAIKEETSLVEVEKSFEMDYFVNWDLHILSSNRILISSLDAKDREHYDSEDGCDYEENLHFKMAVLDKQGRVINFKLFRPRYYRFGIKIDVKVNAAHIFFFDKKNSNVRIFNFNLELVHLFLLDKRYDDFKVNNYEIAFYNQEVLKIACYNYETGVLKKKQVFLNRAQFMSESDSSSIRLNLIHLNDKFIFISKNAEMFKPNVLYQLSRDDGNSIIKTFELSWKCKDNFFNYQTLYVDGKHVCVREEYTNDLAGFKIHFYDSNSVYNQEFVSVDCKRGEFDKIYLRSNNEYLFLNGNWVHAFSNYEAPNFLRYYAY
jgi:hypothetical protein